MKVRDVIRLIEKDGWRGGATCGRRAVTASFSTVAGKFGLDVPPGTLNSILKQSGLKRS